MTFSQLLPRPRDVPALALVTVLYAALALAGLNWGVYRGASTAVWPASGFALAALLLGGSRLWPAILAGRLCAALIVGSAPPLWADIVIALASALGAWLPVEVITRRTRFDIRLTTIGDIVILIGAALAGAILSTLPGITILLASGVTTLARAPEAGVTWFLGYLSGVLLIAPLILSWTPSATERKATSWPLVGAAVFSAAWAFIVFLHLLPLPLRTWHLFPVLAWMAIAFSVRGVSISLVATAIAALVSIQLGVGPLAQLIAGSAGGALYAQDFIAFTSATVLLLAAARDETRHQVAITRAHATRAAVFDAALDAIVTMSGDGRIVEWNREAERMFGIPKGQAVGQDLADLIIPSAYRDAHRLRLKRHLETGGSTIMGRRLEMHALRGGKAFPIEISISAIRLEEGEHFTAYLRDMTSEIAAREKLAEQDQRLRATYERASVGIAEVDRDGRIINVNEQLCAITGRDRASLLAMTIWDDSDPESHGEERVLFARQMAGQLDSYAIEKTFTRADGETACVELRASRVDTADGRPAYGVRVVRDITQEKRWSRQQSLLINELNHRVKNTLASVQSIIAQTMRNRGVDQSVQAAIEERLLALSRAHDVLTRRNWESADLAEIVAVTVRPYVVGQESRLSISGPAVHFPPQAALGFAMALQELATNALKYGAWSTAQGQVQIAWTLSEDEAQAVSLVWREMNGPKVAAPVRRGFGTRLLERGVGAEIGGSCSLEFSPEGLVCRLTAPISPRADSLQTGA